MKANELRIGNYVYFKHCDYDVSTPRKINYTLNPNLVGLERISVNRIEYNNIDPIPLTEEWLLKFGFNYSDDEKCFMSLKVFRTFKFISDYSNNFSTVTYRLNDTTNEIKYIHQLQNLYFALTGEELTLNEPL